VAVSVTSDGEHLFIDKGDIAQQVKTIAKGSLINRTISGIDLGSLERTLEKHTWIRDAELYFDSRDVLHVIVSEREPIARVFTTGGSSFYIDSAGHRMPLLNKVAVRLPLVTNFTPAKKLSTKDSIVLQDIKKMVRFINSDPFWSAQIAQIDITPMRTYELLPVVGSHVIRIGSADDFEEKLGRLFLFYKQVLSKAGLDKYKAIDVQYKGQVIGMKTTETAVIDSVLLQQNIATLIQRSKEQAMQDSIAAVEAFNAEIKRDSAIKELMYSLEEREALEADLPLVKPVEKKDTIVKSIKPQTVIKPNQAVVNTKPASVAKRTNPTSNPVKTKSTSSPVVKPKSEVVKKPQPKAVMQKRQ
jgi:cell division protein FtsQ